MTRLTDLISDSIRWKDFISSTASGLQIHLMVVCPDGSEVSAACPVCGQLYQILSPQNQKEILTKVKNGLVKIQTESGTLVVALQLKRDGVLIVTGCPSCSQSDDQLVNKALICRKLLDSFQGSLYEEMKGGQRAVELSTLRQMNHIILSQFRGNKNALEHSFDLILSALIILLDARGSWLSLDNSPVPKQLVKGDHEQVNNYIKNPQIDTGLSVKVDSRNVRGSLGVIGPLDLEKAKKLLPLMADECLIVLEIEHLFELINRQLSRVFGTIDSAILITDAATIISYANPGFEKLTGHQVVQMIGQELGQFPAPWNKFIKNRPKNNLHGIMDVILDTEGRKRYVNWDLSPLLEDEVLFGWLIIINDKTDHYYWQEAVGQAERLATTSVLIGSLAHELRNPLSAAKGMLQLMGKRRDPDSVRGCIDLSLRELDRVTNLLNEFLLLGKTAEKTDGPIYLKTVLEELMPLLQNEGVLYGVNVRLDIQSLPLVQGDSYQLRQVVTYLVRNAMEATESTGEVEISLFEKDRSAYIAIRDYGPGIPQGVEDKLFRPFFSTKERGTGLGLTVSQAIIHNHGGDISFWNDPDRGAVFNVILPLYDTGKPHTPVDIIIHIKDKLIGYPVMQSLQAAGFKVVPAREDQVLGLVNKYHPQICLLEGVQEQQSLVEGIKKENSSTSIMILGPVEPETGNYVQQVPLPINYSQLLSKVSLSIKAKSYPFSIGNRA